MNVPEECDKGRIEEKRREEKWSRWRKSVGMERNKRKRG